MVVFGVIALILMLVIPVALVVLIIVAIIKRNRENKDSESFEKVVRVIYTYLLIITFLCLSVGSFLSLVDTSIDHFLPEEKSYDYRYDNAYDSLRDKTNTKNENIVNMLTSLGAFAVSLPMFIYHSKLARKDK